MAVHISITVFITRSSSAYFPKQKIALLQAVAPCSGLLPAPLTTAVIGVISCGIYPVIV
jgi:hypothetical protein